MKNLKTWNQGIKQIKEKKQYIPEKTVEHQSEKNLETSKIYILRYESIV